MQEDSQDDAEQILACVDRSHFAEHVTDAAAWASRRTGVSMTLLHIIQRHPETASGSDRNGAIGVNTQQNLLTTLADHDEARSKTSREQGHRFLNRLRERAIAAGVPTPDVRQRYGDLEEVLTEQQTRVQLFVLGRRGESAETTQRDLGRNVERMVRALKRPILAVTQGFQEPRRIMIAYDGAGMTRRGVEMIAASPLLRGLPIHLLMSGKTRKDGPRQLDWARTTLEGSGFEVTCALVPGDAEHIIARHVRDLEIDMLIMGAYGHSPLRGLLLGSKTSDLLRSARIPTLLLR